MPSVQSSECGLSDLQHFSVPKSHTVKVLPTEMSLSSLSRPAVAQILIPQQPFLSDARACGPCGAGDDLDGGGRLVSSGWPKGVYAGWRHAAIEKGIYVDAHGFYFGSAYIAPKQGKDHPQPGELRCIAATTTEESAGRFISARRDVAHTL